MIRRFLPNTLEGFIDTIKELESANVDSVLLPYGPGGNDFSLFLPDTFRQTEKIKMMIAAAAYSVTPEYLAKTFYTAQKFGPNRISLNLVAGRYNDHFAKLAADNYPGDPEIMDDHDKRVYMTEKWMEKFVNLIKDEDYEAKLAVVGSSDLTISVANNYTDYIIINGWMLNSGNMDKITNSKPILVLDPLILNEGQDESDVEYVDYEFSNQGFHPVKGTYDQVKQEILGFAEQHGVWDIMIHTDQKDISQLLRLVKDLSSAS